ncbi:MAG TPA: hypothetical protein VMT63_10480 [Bacteroidales bacterium]|nr:hypothetical protein [Bacteroidales bacterium]
MKTLTWVAWLSLGGGCLIILLALISLLLGKNLFGFTHIVNFFITANTFFLLAIALFIYIYRCKCSKD